MNEKAMDSLATRAASILADAPGEDDGTTATPTRRATPQIVLQPEIGEIVDGMVQVVQRQVRYYLARSYLSPDEVQALNSLSKTLVGLLKEDRTQRRDASQYTREELLEIVREAEGSCR